MESWDGKLERDILFNIVNLLAILVIEKIYNRMDDRRCFLYLSKKKVVSTGSRYGNGYNIHYFEIGQACGLLNSTSFLFI